LLENEIISDNKNPEDTLLNKERKKPHWRMKDMIPSIIYWPLLIAQLIMVFSYYNYCNIDFLACLGWGALILFFIVGSLPRKEFKKRGDIEEGKSFVYTTKLVDTGIYAIIRHPLWLTWILLSLSVTLMSQYWIMALMGIIVMLVVYLETFRLDKNLIEKFGMEYEQYKKKVPRLNIIYGLIKYLMRENEKKSENNE